jgi:hypothetical protein
MSVVNLVPPEKPELRADVLAELDHIVGMAPEIDSILIIAIKHDGTMHWSRSSCRIGEMLGAIERVKFDLHKADDD